MLGPLVDDTDNEEEFTKAKKKGRKSAEDEHASAVHAMRCRLVALSKTNYYAFISYLRDNKSFFKSEENFSAEDRQALRGTCQRALDRAPRFSPEDVAFFDSVFGRYTDPKSNAMKVPTATAEDDGGVPRNITGQVAWYTNATYEAFWKWINSPNTQGLLASHPELKEKVRQCIEENKRQNRVLFYNRGYREYQPEDEQVFEKVLNSMVE